MAPLTAGLQVISTSAKRITLYANADPASRFGRLTFDAWRAARLVVDTGICRMP